MKKTQAVVKAVFQFFFFVFAGCPVYAQCETLHFVELGSHAAFCRTAPYQSGNGVVYAAVAGGTPDYTYLWTNINTGQQTSNSTLGGVNPGDYTIKVTDDAGCILTAIVKVDSVMPTADFNVLSIEQQEDFFGANTVVVTIKNACKHHLADYWATPWPFDDTTNYISVDGGSWENILFHEERSFSFDNIGDHEICISTTNKNGCADTTCKSVTIGESFDDAEVVNIMSSSVTGDFFVDLLMDYPVILNRYDTYGVLLASQTVVPGPNTFSFSTGQYIYDVVDPLTNQVLASGTFFVL